MVIKKKKYSKIMENQKKSNNQMIEDTKECRVKVQNPKDIQKVQPVKIASKQ